MATTSLADLKLQLGGKNPHSATKDFRNQPITGTLHFAALTAKATAATLTCFVADSGMDIVGCSNVMSGPLETQNLKDRLRFGVYRYEAITYAEVTMALLKPADPWPNKCYPGLAALCAACGGDVESFLRERGAVQFATKERLLGTTDRTRTRTACQVSDFESVEALMWLFAVTRFLPVLRQVEDGY